MKKFSGTSPCGCGSGKQFTSCCAEAVDKASTAQALDRETFDVLATRSASMEVDPVRLGLDLYQHIGDVDSDRLQFIMPWAMHHVPVEGRTLSEHVLGDADSLTPPQRAWLEAQRGAWVSLWEVVAVHPGLSVVVRDRLLGEERTVYEEKASEHLLPGVGLLARVVDFDGVSVFCGVHPQPLLAVSLARVVEEVRDRLATLDRDELRTGEASRVLAQLWEEELSAGLDRPLPAMYNTRGEEVYIVSQRWSHDDRDGVLAALRTLPDVEVDEDALSIHLHFLDASATPALAAESDDPFALLNHLGRTIAFASLTGHHLDLTANSKESAARVEAQIEKACGPLLKRVARDVSTLEEMHRR